MPPSEPRAVPGPTADPPVDPTVDPRAAPAAATVGSGPAAVAATQARLALTQARLELVASQDNLEFLRRHLRIRHPDLAGEDVEDVVDTVMTRVIATITAGTWTPRPEPAMIRGYLRKAVDWAVVDLYRAARRSHENPVPNEVLQDLVLTDDQAVAALDQRATTASVRAALRRIRGSGDETLFMVATSILDHIQRTGQRPSNRETGAACGLSHTAVAKALVRLRPYFAEARDTARDA
jgi:hypothetical protein